MNKTLHTPAAVTAQYRTSANLDARIQLHERFGHEPQPWSQWVFDQISAPAIAQILEVGCGTSKLWQENLYRIPPGWQVTLTDQSAGMLQQSQANLGEQQTRFTLRQMDVQSIPYPDATFDVVIANHMLYHVPDLPTALSEIRRVLKPGGYLYAATNGQHHMQELRDLVRIIVPDAFAWQTTMQFRLEDGNDWLAPYFAQVELRRFDSYLLVTESEPLVAYACSTHEEIEQEKVTAFARLVEERRQAQGGAIRIQRDTGLFCAQKEGSTR